MDFSVLGIRAQDPINFDTDPGSALKKIYPNPDLGHEHFHF